MGRKDVYSRARCLADKKRRGFAGGDGGDLKSHRRELVGFYTQRARISSQSDLKEWTDSSATYPRTRARSPHLRSQKVQKRSLRKRYQRAWSWGKMENREYLI